MSSAQKSNFLRKLDSQNKLDLLRIHQEESRKKILKMEKKRRIHKVEDGMEKNEMQRRLI
jgi:hypothetical protein